jgi:putative flippase GtrA
MVKQFIKFGIVGLSNTVIGYGIYVVTLFLLQQFAVFHHIDIYIAQFVMFILSVAWSFYWNNKYVFKKGPNENRNALLALLKTYASYAFTSLFLSEFLLVLWIEVLHVNGYIAPIFSLLITVPLNYVIQKKWVFR